MATYRTIDEVQHSEDLQEIVSKPPSWLLKRGTSLILLTVLLIIGLSLFIRYPEIVQAPLKFNTGNAPKVLINKVNGNLTKILIKDGEWVNASTVVAFLESTGDHAQILNLLNTLKEMRNKQDGMYVLENIISPNVLNLGELQGSYQNFYLSYLNYRAVNQGGIYQKRRNVLLQESANIREQNKRIQESYALQLKQLEITQIDYDRYRKLAERKIVSPAELQQKEALLLAKQQVIPQMENSMIGNETNLLSKNKELSEIDNQILEEDKKYVQSLNSFISEAENWKKQYVLTAPSSGKLIYTSFLQENQYIPAGQELFYVNPNDGEFYGETFISQRNSSKVKKGQQVLIKVRSYPYEEYGYLHGEIDYISDIPIKDSVFFSRISLNRTAEDSVIRLKPGILADAEIITEDQSIFKRIWLNVTKSLKL